MDLEWSVTDLPAPYLLLRASTTFLPESPSQAVLAAP